MSIYIVFLRIYPEYRQSFEYINKLRHEDAALQQQRRCSCALSTKSQSAYNTWPIAQFAEEVTSLQKRSLHLHTSASSSSHAMQHMQITEFDLLNLKRQLYTTVAWCAHWKFQYCANFDIKKIVFIGCICNLNKIH